MEEDIDTYEPDTPTERAVARRLGVSVEYVQHFLTVFEEEFDRIETLQWERIKNARAGKPE
jgi:hypothetical protein